MSIANIFSSLQKSLSAVKLRKAQALLFFLVSDPGTIHRSEKVIDLFWQESDRQRASSSYRQAIRHIRKELDESEGIKLFTSPGEISLRFAQKFSFVESLFQDLASSGWDADGAERIREALSYTYRFEGVSSSFDSWLAITRSGFLSRVRRSLDQRLNEAGTGNMASLREPASFALELEPSNETASRILMTLDWQQGHATRAIERYNALYAYLDQEFDQEPEPETVELLAAIKLNPESSSGAHKIFERHPEVSLTVILQPGEGVPPQMASFGTVLFADLRMRMGRFREWRVIEPTGAERAQALIILRPVQAFDRYQLFVDVQRGADGHLLWSEAIDQPETDWETKARVVLSNIANALSVVVSDKSLSDSGLFIYDRWLRAQALLDAWSPETEHQALEMLQDITRDAPRFGVAHAELAGALNVRHVLLPGTSQTEDVKQRALHHAIMAVSIDPLDTRAHRVLGWCYCHKREFGLAEFHFDQALNLNRSNPLTLASCALGFAFSGSLARAGSLVAEARQHPSVMEPFHLIYIAAVDYLTKDYALAAEGCSRGTGLMPTVGGWHALALWKMGQKQPAMDRLGRFLASIRSAWQSSEPDSDERIIDWFVGCFPMRDEAVLDDLRLSLLDIAANLPRH